MKLRIFVKRFKDEEGKPYVNMPLIVKKGDWIDLSCSRTMILNAPQAGTLKGKEAKHRDVVSEVTYIPLGVAMRLPDGFEAIIAPRSSTADNLGLLMVNAPGVVDNCYKGNNDEWHFPVTTLRKTSISAKTRVCQFRIQLSQKATIKQKILWFLTTGIELVEVESLDDVDRGGLGSTGLN